MKEEIKIYLLRSFLFVLFVLLIAVIGYHFIEKISWVDSIYMAVITITTVGFREVKPLSAEGKIFTIFVILLGVGALFYFAQNLMRFTLESEIYGSLIKRRLFGKLRELKEHYIVCGFGRVGSHVALELAKYKVPFVVIDNSTDATSYARSFGYLAIEGDATDEKILRLVGVERARGLIACLPSDALNLYAILTARAINPQLYIVARVEHEEAEERFLKIGVNRVVSLHSTAGKHMARLVLNPYLESTADIIVGPQAKITVEQVEVHPNCQLINKTIGELNKTCDGATIIGVIRSGNIIWNPAPSLLVEANDILIVAGSTESLLKLGNFANICKFGEDY